MYSYARGLFLKRPIAGSATSAKVLFRVKKDQFIYSRLFAFEGAYGVVPAEFDGAFVSNEYPTFDVDRSRLLPQFLELYFKQPTVWEAVAKASTGVGHRRQRVPPSGVLSTTIPLPPLSDQQGMVARIDAIAGKIEEAKRLRGEAEQEAAALWERAAAEFCDRSVEDAPLRPLADILEVRGGGTPSKSNPFFWEGRIPWVSPKDMKLREIRDSIDHISEAATRETAAKLVEPGAVLVVVRGMILAHTVPSAVLRVPAAINQDMKALIPGPDLLPEYLAAWFWAYNHRLLGLVEKSTHDTRKLQTPKLLDTKIPVPPIEQQRRIIDDLLKLERRVRELVDHQSLSAIALDAVMPAVLDRAFRGEM
jgi:type I restriction enzyme S subunit